MGIWHETILSSCTVAKKGAAENLCHLRIFHQNGLNPIFSLQKTTKKNSLNVWHEKQHAIHILLGNAAPFTLNVVKKRTLGTLFLYFIKVLE